MDDMPIVTYLGSLLLAFVLYLSSGLP
jgi:hypothetical protein